MTIYARDWIFGNFTASHHQLYPASFTVTANDEEETGIGVTTTEEYISDNPVPIYIGQKYSDKLKPTIVLTKDSCVTDDEYFSEYDCRAILREVIGQRGYQWMKLITEEIGEDLWYRARTTNVRYQRVSGKIVGVILDMECDSQFAWSTLQSIVINAQANTPFYVFSNSDALFDYVKPTVTIIPGASGDLSVVNSEDNNWEVKFTGAKSGETIIYDCKNEVIDGSRNESGQAITKYLDYSNCHFFRLLEGKNTYTSNLDATFKFEYRVPRRVSFAIH